MIKTHMYNYVDVKCNMCKKEFEIHVLVYSDLRIKKEKYRCDKCKSIFNGHNGETHEKIPDKKAK